MNVLGLSGSPRTGANTDILVQQVLEGSAAEGADTKMFKLADLNITGCRGCFQCKQQQDACVIDDDMQTVYHEIAEADAFIVGSPVYMWQMSAQTKVFLDRLFALFKGPKGASQKTDRKPVVLMFNQGNPDSSLFQSYFEHTAKMYEFLGFAVDEVIVAAGARDRGDVLTQTEVLEKARKIGRTLVTQN